MYQDVESSPLSSSPATALGSYFVAPLSCTLRQASLHSPTQQMTRTESYAVGK